MLLNTFYDIHNNIHNIILYIIYIIYNNIHNTHIEYFMILEYFLEKNESTSFETLILFDMNRILCLKPYLLLYELLFKHPNNSLKLYPYFACEETKA